MRIRIHGKLPQRKITTGAAAGYSSYGNQIGLATGQVTELYRPRLCGQAHGDRRGHRRVSEGERRCATSRSPGDVIVLLGGATGRDGCGGATGSSKAHTRESIEVCGAEVQKGNPPTERKIQRLFRNPEVSTLIKRCNDFGAGGVCVAIGELADRALSIDLNKVPKKYEGLDGTELAISESQERMAVVLDPEGCGRNSCAAGAGGKPGRAGRWPSSPTRARLTMRVARRHASWTSEPRIPRYQRRDPECRGASSPRRTQTRDYRNAVPACLKVNALDEALCSRTCPGSKSAARRALSERFDASIGAGTVLMPFAGKYQLTPGRGHGGQDSRCSRVRPTTPPL